MQAQLLELFVFLPFVSGPALMHLIADKKKWALGSCDKLIAGALLGNFMLIAPSILVGFFSNCLGSIFEIYTLLSLAALVLFLFRVLRQKKWRLLPNIKLTGFGFEGYGFPILLFALFVLFFHTLFLEYDAIYFIFPYAKSIALTGSMKYNIYDQSTLSTGMAPVLPVIYGWAFATIDDLNAIGIQNDFRWQDLLRPIPAAYFLLTALVIYLISREALQKKYAFFSVIIFMSLPTTILTLSASTYYFDLGFVFYLVSAMLCLARAIKTQKPIWFFLAGVASSLLLLAKELSVFIIPLIFAMLILFSSIGHRRPIFVVLSTLPFYALFFFDLHAFPIADYGWILVRQVPVFALSACLYYLSNIEKRPNFLTWKNFALFLVPLIPSVVFLLRGMVSLNSLYSVFSWEPTLKAAVGLFYINTGILRTREVTSFLRWDIPFLSLSLGVAYFIPIMLSILCHSKRKHHGDKVVSLMLLMMLFTLIETMSFTLVGSQTESRRMYYLAPIIAIFAANGLMILDEYLKSDYFIYLCTLFNSLAISYIWLYRFPFQTILGLSYLKTSLELASALDLAFFLLVFVAIFLVLPIAPKKFLIKDFENSQVMIRTRKGVPAIPLKLENLSLGGNIDRKVEVCTRRIVPQSLITPKKPHLQHLHSFQLRFRMRKRIVYVSLFTLSCILIVYPVIPLWLQGVNEGLSLRYNVYSSTWENGILTVSKYYNLYIDDEYVTVSFGGQALRYFANRSVIDLTTLLGVQSMQDTCPGALTLNTPEDLLRSINNSNVKYFLIPRSSNSFYNLYLSFRENSYLFKFLERDEHFLLVKEFDFYQLFRFIYTQ